MSNDFEEIELPYEYAHLHPELMGEGDGDDEDDDSKKTLAFKEYNVKKIKIDEELIKNLKYYDISYLTQDGGEEGYLSSYSFLDYVKFKMPVKFPRIQQIDIYNVDFSSLVDKIFSFKEFIPDYCYTQTLTKTGSIVKHLETFITFRDSLGNPVHLFIDHSQASVIFVKQSNQLNETVLTVLGMIENYSEKKGAKNKIYVVYKTQHGFEKTGFKVKRVNVNLFENYNDDFPSVAKDIIAGLNKKNKTNLVILSGCPGSGKTTFIRYLASRIKKNIIFISPDMVNYITDPSFIPFLIKNNDSVLIIEDAEPALETRESGRTGAVSNILNLTDGLLSDCLNISIVATFNTETNKIDSALLRKGRLLKNYKFEKLSAEKSTNLLKKLGHDVKATQPMSLSDIYYYAEDNNAPQQTSVKPVYGFRSNA